jgi:hypothetical protein
MMHLDSELEKNKKATNEIREKNTEDKNKASTREEEKLYLVEQHYLRQIDNLKSEARTNEEKLMKELN